MKKNDDGQDEDFTDRAEECPENGHIRCGYEDLDEIQRQNTHEDLNGDRSAHPHIELIKYIGDNYDLKQIDRPNWYDPGEKRQTLYTD